MSSELEGAGGQGEIILYPAADGGPRIECRLVDDSLWLTQRLMAELFQTSVPNISQHLSAIYEEGELNREGTVKQYLIVRREGQREVTRQVDHYSLEAILAVGYRVRSPRGTAFRQWATERLSEYLVKGFTMDDHRLKNPGGEVTDYFDEMLAKIRDIRSSERRMYLQVRNILALAADYDPKEAETTEFFQTVQNKMHFAATGKTAPELIAERADATKPNMGLTAWKGEVVRKGDVTVAKNYLNGTEIEELNRIVSMFLDFAEDQARRRKQVFMRDWRTKLDEFLRFNDRTVLGHAGKVSRETADRRAFGQYEEFHRRRLAEMDAKAERDTMDALESMAKALPKRKKSAREKKGK
jgi:hypothetical protein